MRISNITNLGAMTRTGSGGGGGAGSAPAAPAAPAAKPPKTMSMRPTTTGSTAQSRSGATLAPTTAEVKPSASTKVVKPSASSMQSMTADVVKAAAKEAQLTLRQQSGDTSFTTAMAVAEAQAKTAAAAEKAAALRAQLVLAQETKQAVTTPASVTTVPDATTTMTETRTPSYDTPEWYTAGGSSGSARPLPSYSTPSSGGGGAETTDVKTTDTKMTEADSGMKSGARAPSHDSTMSRWLKYGGAALAAGAVGFIAYKRLKKN